MSFLPYGRQSIDEDDIAAVTAVLRGDWLTTGPAVKLFEDRLSAATGNGHAIAVSSGTAALHLAALALGLGPGDAVIVPTITFVATANAARYVGADVIFADVDPQTGLMEVPQLEEALERSKNKNVRAVFPVHLNGQAPDMEAISRLARSRDLAIVEDACHSLGGSYIGSDGTVIPIGSCAFSDISIFSFHPVKTIAMGEGGALTCQDETLADRIRHFRDHGIERRAEHFVDPDGANKPWYYEFQDLGFNYRASDIHCALGASQLTKLDEFVSKRRIVAEYYDNALASSQRTVLPIRRVNTCLPAWHIYPLLINFDEVPGGRARVMALMKAAGIGSQVHYIPVHTQPYYQEASDTGALLGAATYYNRCLSLPIFPRLKEDDIQRVCESITDICH